MSQQKIVPERFNWQQVVIFSTSISVENFPNWEIYMQCTINSNCVLCIHVARKKMLRSI